MTLLGGEDETGRTEARCENEMLDMEDSLAAVSAANCDVPLLRRVLRGIHDG
jgi:hypothetical protein